MSQRTFPVDQSAALLYSHMQSRCTPSGLPSLPYTITFSQLLYRVFVFLSFLLSISAETCVHHTVYFSLFPPRSNSYRFWHFSPPSLSSSSVLRSFCFGFITPLLSIQFITCFSSSSSSIPLLSSFHHCFPYLIPPALSAARKHCAFPLRNENLVLFTLPESGLFTIHHILVQRLR